MNDNEFWFRVNILLAIVAVVGMLTSSSCLYYTDKQFSNNGYCQVQKIGAEGNRWVKCDMLEAAK